MVNKVSWHWFTSLDVIRSLDPNRYWIEHPISLTQQIFFDLSLKARYYHFISHIRQYREKLFRKYGKTQQRKEPRNYNKYNLNVKSICYFCVHTIRFITTMIPLDRNDYLLLHYHGCCRFNIRSTILVRI